MARNLKNDEGPRGKKEWKYYSGIWSTSSHIVWKQIPNLCSMKENSLCTVWQCWMKRLRNWNLCGMKVQENGLSQRAHDWARTLEMEAVLFILTDAVLMISAKHNVTQVESVKFLSFTELQKKMVKISSKHPSMWGKVNWLRIVWLHCHRDGLHHIF
jgi:hypothetical protein